MEYVARLRVSATGPARGIVECGGAREGSRADDVALAEGCGGGLHALHVEGVVDVQLDAGLEGELQVERGVRLGGEAALLELTRTTEALELERVRARGAPGGHVVEPHALVAGPRARVYERDAVDVDVQENLIRRRQVAPAELATAEEQRIVRDAIVPAEARRAMGGRPSTRHGARASWFERRHLTTDGDVSTRTLFVRAPAKSLTKIRPAR